MSNKKSNEARKQYLGMSVGTAQSRLRKQIFLRLAQKCGEDICFRCGEKILSSEELSIDHKISWMGNSPELFWDMDNIAFSHLKCNIGAGTRQGPIEKHGLASQYQKGCRCKECTEAKRISNRKYL